MTQVMHMCEKDLCVICTAVCLILFELGLCPALAVRAVSLERLRAFAQARVRVDRSALRGDGE